jgi:hypothetical protein
MHRNKNKNLLSANLKGRHHKKAKAQMDDNTKLAHKEAGLKGLK